MLYDELLEQLENSRVRRKPRGADRIRARRLEDYLYAESENYLPRKSKPRDADGEDYIEYNRRERRRDPHWKRRRED